MKDLDAHEQERLANVRPAGWRNPEPAPRYNMLVIGGGTAGLVGLGTLANVIHSYPTQADAIRKAADAYLRSRLTPTLRKLSSRWLAWAR